MSKPKTNSEIHFVCELCESPVHLSMKLGELAGKIPDFDVKQTTYRHGLCATCKSELEAGCVFFTDSAGRVIKVSEEASKEKIQKEYWGKVVKIPKGAMEELIRVWASSQPKPPSEFGDGDVTAAR